MSWPKIWTTVSGGVLPKNLGLKYQVLYRGGGIVEFWDGAALTVEPLTGVAVAYRRWEAKPNFDLLTAILRNPRLLILGER